MAESSVTTVSGVWAPAAAVLFLGLGLFTATLDGALAAHGAGRGAGAASVAVSEIARLMRQRRRATVAADTLLWRVVPPVCSWWRR